MSGLEGWLIAACVHAPVMVNNGAGETSQVLKAG
jgi:hypothetical protein